MEVIPGITHFNSAVSEPVAGVSDEDVLAGLAARAEVSQARLLVGGFILIKFKEPMGREELAAFKTALEGIARVHENRRCELHGATPAGGGGEWGDDYL